MKTLLAIILLTGGVLFYRMKSTAAGDDLQGRWTIVSAPEGWKVTPGMDVMVTSNEIQMRLGTVVTSKLHYTADFETGTIDATAAGGQLRQGIYRLDGDLLTLCVGAEGAPRPDTPDTTSGGAMKWVLRRGGQL